MDAVKKQHELNDTVFIFTSDNGFFYGEHRIAKGKPDPYEENINMPLTVSVPPKFRDRAPLVPTSDAPVANIDLWQRILAGMKEHRIDWKWVRGHSGHDMNERADRLATEARKAAFGG
ncbi:MAG: sulfatase-like hydrolase/transferase [Rhodospirillales bacterium]|nr:sulfatase-like hydrolase/transferase [Acetobacter sp.]